jgi:hypothetical protein
VCNIFLYMHMRWRIRWYYGDALSCYCVRILMYISIYMDGCAEVGVFIAKGCLCVCAKIHDICMYVCDA